MTRLILILTFIWLIQGNGISQSGSIERMLGEIAFHADISVNAVRYEHRLRAHDQMVMLLDSFLLMPGSLATSLDSIPWLSTLRGDDFRVISWQLKISEDEYRYGGRMQWVDHFVSLKDNRPFYNGSAFGTFSTSAWYGCLYYEIIPFERDKVKYYALLGFNAENSMLNTKIADVLDVSGVEPVLGLPVFVNDQEARSRLIFTYADASAAHMRYDPKLEAIVHDHLINMPGVGVDGEALPVSDGSLEAWILKKGNWIYEEEVYDVKVKNPPMTNERKGKKEEKDILGRPVKD